MSDSDPVRFRNGPRVPPLWFALLGFIFLTGAWVLSRGEPASPNAYWQIPVALLVMFGIPAAIFIPKSWGTVEVGMEGLVVRGRLVVPAGELGRVDLLSGLDASYAALSLGGRRTRVPARQNLYGGGYGWGKGVAVEHLEPGGRSTLWVLPGPRTEELAAALEAVRDAEAKRQPGDDWSRRSMRRSGEDR